LWRRPVTTNVVKSVVTAATVVPFTIAIAARDGAEPADNNIAGSTAWTQTETASCPILSG
jgi:hypothetical protein